MVYLGMDFNVYYNLSCQNCLSLPLCHVQALAPKALINEHKITNEYKKGQVLFAQGNPDCGAYFLLAGEIQLQSYEHPKSSKLINAKGAIINPEAISSSSSTHEFTATATTNSVVCFLDTKFCQRQLKKQIMLNHLDQPSIN